MSESAYLKDELGPVLAKGLAAAAIAKPSDPHEYLALWLLHYVQQKEKKSHELEVTRKLEEEREQWAKGRAAREKAATAIIQREWKAHVHTLQEAQQKDGRLRQAFARLEETLGEKFPDEELTEAEGKNENEKQTEGDRLATKVNFFRCRCMAEELDKSYIADLKHISGSNKSAVLVLKCCFYLMGLRPKQLDSWEKIRGLIKPYPFSQWLITYDPIGPSGALEKKRKIRRVKRLLSLVTDEDVKKENTALHAIFQWIAAAVQYREARDENIVAKKAAGKEAEEEFEDEEEAEEEEKDADEEVIRAKELEEQKQREAEAALEAADAVVEE